MDFDEEHEEQEEEIEMHQNYQGLGNSGTRGNEAVSPVAAVSARKSGGVSYRYRECLRNHAVGIGGQAVDGCGEFMAAGEEGTLDALKCAVCNCHRNFHRKEIEGEGFQHQPHPGSHNPSLHHHHHHSQFSPSYFRSSHPSGYLHVTQQPRTLALPSTSRDDEDMSNPSSSGGGGGGGGGGSGVGGSRKRFRTKFTQEQKDKMLAFAESVGWRIQKQDEAAVQQFCAESNVKRHVLKVWMHNNKHTLGKKP